MHYSVYHTYTYKYIHMYVHIFYLFFFFRCFVHVPNCKVIKISPQTICEVNVKKKIKKKL